MILTGSCARGKATRDSCLDIIVLLPPKIPVHKRSELEHEWNDFYERSSVFSRLRKAGKYSHVDLDFVDGHFVPEPRSWTSGPDDFELKIGNTLVYMASLWENGDRLKRLKAKFLPYYNEELRRARLADVRNFCSNNLDHVPLYVDRRLHFQAFDRLYKAFQEFLQLLFISHRIYPIAYDKWIKEQIEEILGMPELYKQLPSIFEIRNFQSREITVKAEKLGCLVNEYTQ